MIPRQEPPEDVAYTTTGKWDHCKIAPGGKIKGWLAGPPAWLPVHSVHARTLPCRSTITKGALKCAYCGPGVQEEWKGLLPFLNELRKQSSVWVSRQYRDHLESLSKWCQILLTKGKNPKDPIEVRHELWTPLELPEATTRRWPCDPTPAALVWWRDPELTQWCIEQRGKAPPVAADTPAVRQMYADLGVLGGDDGGVPLDDTTVSRNEAFARAARGGAGRNGKHKPTG